MFPKIAFLCAAVHPVFSVIIILILREKGSKKIDDSIKVTGASMWLTLAVVDQDITLFEDSVANNIKMWDTTNDRSIMVNREGGRERPRAAGAVCEKGG